MPAGAGNPPNIKMEPPKSNFNIREGGGERFNIRGKGLVQPDTEIGTALTGNVRPNETTRLHV